MRFEEGQTVGIDLGTTFSTIAQLDESGAPVPLPNEDGEVETASLVLLADSGHVLVGPNRIRAAMEDPENVVDRVKRHMGSTEYKRTFDGREVTPEFISALILKKLRKDAEKKIGKIGNAVITVPYYFNDARRKATQDAGKIAGLHVIDIINEPTAATLTYAWHCGELGMSESRSRARKVLVYDLGGGTFDVTVVQFTPTHFQVLATDGDVHLGGVDWNDRLVDHVAGEFKARHGGDPRESPATLQMLRNDCDQAKIDLSEKNEAKIHCRHTGKSLTVTVTRAQFDAMTADLLQRTADTMEMVLDQAKLSFDDLDATVLVGGSTLMPQVPKMVRRVTGRDPYTGISPYTSVAQGAAIHAAILEAKYRDGASGMTEKVRKMLLAVKQENVNSHGMGVAATNPRSGKTINHVMIPRNTRLPAEAKQVFKTVRDGQDRVSIHVLEGDAPDPAACSKVGKCRITGLPPGLPKGSLVEVTYAFDEAGRITVSAEEKSSGKAAAIQIERRGLLSESEVDAYSNLAQDYKVD